MQVHPMVTVKKAANVLGIHKEAIRRKLASGEIKGERRRVGSKDKWLIYSGEVEYLLEKQRIPELVERAERTSVEGLTDFFTGDAEPIEAEPVDDAQAQLPAHTIDINAVIETLTREFAYRLAEERQTIIQLQDKLFCSEQSLNSVSAQELKLSRSNRDNQSKELEIKTLRTHVALLEGKLEDLRKPWWKRWL